MANYGNLNDLKNFLGISDTSEDKLLGLLLPQASALVDEYCDRSFGQASYTEYYMGTGKPYFALRQRPVVSIASLYLDELAYWGQAPGAFASSTLLTQGVDYALQIDQANGTSRSGLVFNVNGWWPEPFNYSPGIITAQLGPPAGNIKVTYTAGYGVVPANVVLATYMTLAKIRNSAGYGQALASENYEEYGYSLPVDSQRHVLSSEIRSLLSRYRNVAVA